MSTSSVFEWSKRGWMPNGLAFECHLNPGQMDAILFSYVLVWYLNGWSSAQDISLKRPFEILTSKNFGIQMDGIHSLTVLDLVQNALTVTG